MKKSKTALITGASKGLGKELALALAQQGWNLLITARNAKVLKVTKMELAALTNVIAIAGSVRDEVHLLELPELLETRSWSLDLVVNNASSLGISPLSALLNHPIENLHEVFHTNMIAPISLLQKIKRFLNKDAMVINISSDAAVETYENWGAYSGSKAGLDHMTAILNQENPGIDFFSFDPGDMRTEMHQSAFPGEDISDRPLPSEFAVPSLLQLINKRPLAGRYSYKSLNSAAV